MSNIDSYLHLRYKPKRANFKGCDPCPAFELFDWVIWKPDAAAFYRIKIRRPKKILCLAHPKSIKLLGKFKRFLDKECTIVIAGEDTNLSQVSYLIEQLLPYCKNIFFEAKDIELPKVQSFSMGFISYYLKRSSEGVITRLQEKLKNQEIVKEGLLASWGGVWKHLDEKLADRKAATKFVDESSWIQREVLEADEYWRRLAESEFLISPAGQGVQAPKLAEAWLMHTVPIVTPNPCFRDLEKAGYPFFFVDKWQHLTPDSLVVAREQLRYVNWVEVQEMLTVKYFQKNVLKA